MASRYEDLTPSMIENATMQKVTTENGVLIGYTITPNDGYVLHDKGMDEPVYDEETGDPTGEVRLGYRRTTASCGANYDFVVNPREFYAVPENSVPADQIFGITTKPEVM